MSCKEKESKDMMKEKTTFGNWYHKYISSWLPEYGILSLAACCIFNNIIYTGTQILLRNAYHYDLTGEWDRRIPFIKEWVSVYVICFAFWAFSYILIAREGKEHWYRFVTADMMSRLICAVFFILMPTTNVRPRVDGSDFFSWLIRLVYALDAPTNLFPSIHCLVSWFCFIGIRKSKKLPVWFKVFSCIFAALVCMSTQFTKQHYLLDIPGGILIAELCYYITTHTEFFRKVERVFDRIGRSVFGVSYYDE